MQKEEFKNLEHVLRDSTLKMNMLIKLFKCHVWSNIKYIVETWKILEHVEMKMNAFTEKLT